MVGVTFLISVFFSALVLVLRPGAAIGIVIMSNLLWPTYLRIPLGIAQMSAARIVVLVLLIRLLVRPYGKGIRLNWLDILIIAGFIWDIVANVAAGADNTQLVYLVGRTQDTILVYFAARLSLRKSSDYKAMVVPLVICGVFLGIVGALESITTRSIYEPLQVYNEFVWIEKEPDYRLGLLRAEGSSTHYIFWGLSMFMVTGFLFSLRDLYLDQDSEGKKSKKWLWWGGVIGSIIGVLSSLSSGPIGALFVLLVSSSFYYVRPLIKPVVWSLVILAILIDIFSNRRFYHLVDYLALSSTTAWYRTKLLEVAVRQLPEYWLFGFGGVRPDHWGKLVDGRNHVDPVNNYVIVALNGGLMGFILFFWTQIVVLWRSIRLWKYGPKEMRIYAFSQGCLLIALMMGSMSAGLFSSVLSFSYILYGSIPNVKKHEYAQVKTKTEELMVNG
ncbi:MAG: O-antigen ligase family protein [Gomphosphaeria aponina SAG 52.96 = DSM 107014]|uniref:O-antigen ligase family protein n=1 Tax=Gomphosphaeria aponina SAG 52.96 = DSM 107014 TaxID=1521640 RepID=A0A941GRR4_9CHRO|nr:O-antigen ligase family protein [Gomphosphaeria aponina SAG 52.96 = DSM 107014]